jgi:hypothetical protein
VRRGGGAGRIRTDHDRARFPQAPLGLDADALDLLGVALQLVP